MEHHLDLVSAVAIPYFNFALFIVALVFFFRKPLTAMAMGRRSKFLDASKDAAQALTVAQQKFDEIKTKFDTIEAELASFKKESEALAHDEAKRLVAEGERIATQILGETKRLAVEEISRARSELRQEIVAAAKKAAEVKLESELSEADKARILASRAAELQKYHV